VLSPDDDDHDDDDEDGHIAYMRGINKPSDTKWETQDRPISRRMSWIMLFRLCSYDTHTAEDIVRVKLTETISDWAQYCITTSL
jgi:hypothetical protein